MKVEVQLSFKELNELLLLYYYKFSTINTSILWLDSVFKNSNFQRTNLKFCMFARETNPQHMRFLLHNPEKQCLALKVLHFEVKLLSLISGPANTASSF